MTSKLPAESHFNVLRYYLPNSILFNEYPKAESDANVVAGGLLSNTSLIPKTDSDYVSKVLLSNSPPKPKSNTNYVSNLRFGHEKWRDGKLLLTEPVQFQPERKSAYEVQEFLSRESLITTPLDTDGLSPYLTTSQQVIKEAKRVHFNLFKDLFKGKKYAMLFELEVHENKGDAALGVAEFVLLENMNIELVLYMDIGHCGEKHFERPQLIASKYPKQEIIILLHGGGNIFGYGSADVCRGKVFRHFPDYQFIMLPQSIYMRATRDHFNFAHRLYCCNPRLTMLMRDRLSLQIARRLFDNGTQFLLAPDSAFQLGYVNRFAPPYYDVSWQKREDSEGPRYEQTPQSLFPANVSVWVWDWLKMQSLSSKIPLHKAVNIMENGLGILQKGNEKYSGCLRK